MVPTPHPSQRPALVSVCLLVETGDLETESMPLETQGGGSSVTDVIHVGQVGPSLSGRLLKGLGPAWDSRTSSKVRRKL